MSLTANGAVSIATWSSIIIFLGEAVNVSSRTSCECHILGDEIKEEMKAVACWSDLLILTKITGKGARLAPALAALPYWPLGMILGRTIGCQAQASCWLTDDSPARLPSGKFSTSLSLSLLFYKIGMLCQRGVENTYTNVMYTEWCPEYSEYTVNCRYFHPSGRKWLRQAAGS